MPNSEYSADPAKLIAQQHPTLGASAQTIGAALTNNVVLALKAARPGDELIIQKIKSAPANYTLGAGDLIALKNAGLSDAVISAMLAAPPANY